MRERPTGWETAYRNRPSEWYGSDDSQHEDCERLAAIFGEHGVRRVLDLGCGDGRHLVWFARQGFEVCGLDIAPTAIDLASKWLTQEGLTADLAACDMTLIPWPDAQFGAVVTVQVINHHRIREIRQTIDEIHRVLRPGGLVYLTVSTGGGEGAGGGGRKSVEVEPKTFVRVDGHEAGVAHYQFDRDELLREFSRFSLREDLMPLHTDSHGYTCVLWQKPEARA